MPDPRLATLLPGDYGRIYTHPVTREQHVSSTTVLKVLAKKLDGWAGDEAAGAAWDNRRWLMDMTREQAVAAFGRASDRTRNQAGDHGSYVHKGCELLAMSYAGWPLRPEQQRELTTLLTGAQGVAVQQGVLRFAEWWNTYVEEAWFLEQTVWGNGWAGTFDSIVKLKDGRMCLVDYKSSKAIYREPKLQLASYWGAPIMLNAEGLQTEMPKIDICTVLHLPQAGGYTFLDLEVSADDLEVFEKLIEVWHWTLDVPLNPGVPIPVATAPRVQGVRDCGQRRPSKSGQAGTVACIEPQGHYPGTDHHGKSKTGSRHYYWRDTDAPGAAASPPFADAGQGSPNPPVLRPVPDVQDGGAGTDSSDIAVPVLGSIGADEDPGFYGLPNYTKDVPEAPAVVAPSAQPPALDVPGASTGPETTDTSSPSGSDPISLPVQSVPGPVESGAAAAQDSGGFPVPAPDCPVCGTSMQARFDERFEEYYDATDRWYCPDEGAHGELQPLDEAEAYSAKISQLFSKPGEA